MEKRMTNANRLGTTLGITAALAVASGLFYSFGGPREKLQNLGRSLNTAVVLGEEILPQAERTLETIRDANDSLREQHKKLGPTVERITENPEAFYEVVEKTTVKTEDGIRSAGKTFGEKLKSRFGDIIKEEAIDSATAVLERKAIDGTNRTSETAKEIAPLAVVESYNALGKSLDGTERKLGEIKNSLEDLREGYDKLKVKYGGRNFEEELPFYGLALVEAPFALFGLGALVGYSNNRRREVEEQ